RDAQVHVRGHRPGPGRRRGVLLDPDHLAAGGGGPPFPPRPGRGGGPPPGRGPAPSLPPPARARGPPRGPPPPQRPPPPPRRPTPEGGTHGRASPHRGRKDAPGVIILHAAVPSARVVPTARRKKLGRDCHSVRAALPAARGRRRPSSVPRPPSAPAPCRPGRR